MGVSSKHILQQGPVLAGLGRTALAALKQRISGTASSIETPGPVLEATYSPRPRDLIRDYVKNVGGDPRDYRRELPPHMWPQWGFGLASKTLVDLPYPITRVVNAGSRLEVNNPVPNDEPLHVTAQLLDIDDNGRRAVLHQKIVTSTDSAPEALVGYLYALVPLGDGGEKEKKKKEKPRVPEGAHEVARWKIPSNAGLDFAKLTGDFNPLHWVPAYARAAGFPNTILHGFSTMARTYEGLQREHFKGTKTLSVLDVKFTRPLVLPADAGLYVEGDDGVYVGDAPEGPAYMVGEFET